MSTWQKNRSAPTPRSIDTVLEKVWWSLLHVVSLLTAGRSAWQ
jgi:hypothetical protein